MSRYSITINGQTYQVEFQARRGSTLSFSIEGISYSVDIAATSHKTENRDTTRASRNTSSGPQQVRSPIPGIISEVRVTLGESICADTTLVVVEAMKMENPIKASRAGTVRLIHVTKGQEVSAGHILVEID